MTPRILHMRDNAARKMLTKGTAVYVGRPMQSEGKEHRHFGNPFTHLRGTTAKYVCTTRHQAVECYRLWLSGKLVIDGITSQREWIMSNLHTLRGKCLVCWCTPYECHASVLLKLANGKGL